MEQPKEIIDRSSEVIAEMYEIIAGLTQDIEEYSSQFRSETAIKPHLRSKNQS